MPKAAQAGAGSEARGGPAGRSDGGGGATVDAHEVIINLAPHMRCTGKAFTRMSTQKQAQVLMVGDALCCSGHRPGTSLSVSRQGQL